MKILFLTQIVPFPPDAGPKIKTWNVLRYLARKGHEVILASFVRYEELDRLEALSDLCSEIHAVPIKRSRIRDIGHLARSFISGRPFLVERDDLQGMRELVSRLLKSNDFDFVHADQLTMTQFALPEGLSPRVSRNRNHSPNQDRVSRRPLLIFDAHNAVWTIVERMRQRVPFPLRPLVDIEARRVKSYEGMIVSEFDHTLAVTENDRMDLLRAVEIYSVSGDASSRAIADRVCISVIPIAVDTTLLQPVSLTSDSPNILTLGTLHYPPNADGIRWFVREVFPLIRQKINHVRLTIIGKNPPPDFLEFPREFNGAVTVTGYVPDLEPYFQDSALAVIPVRAGGGMRVRILEAFARGMPVVTTTVGLEGIDAVNDRDVLVRDTPSSFAAAVIALLQNKELQLTLRMQGRRLAEQRYDWEVVLHLLDPIYEAAGRNRAS